MLFAYKPLKKFFYAIIIILIVLILYLLGMVFTEGNYEWYMNLHKPSFQPPSWVFMLIWAVLFILIASSAILVLFEPKTKEKKCGFTIVMFVINALLNAIWSILFFGLHNILLSLIELPFLLASTVLLIMCAHKVNKIAAYLLMPYFLWLCYATVLMVNVFFIN